MNMKENKIVWKIKKTVDYTTFKEYNGSVRVLIPLTKENYDRLRDSMDKVLVTIFEKDKVFTNFKVTPNQILMLATRTAIETSWKGELKQIIEEVTRHGGESWIPVLFDKEYNMVGYTDGVCRMTLGSDPIKIFNEKFGHIGNPEYFIVIKVMKHNINSITYEGLKRAHKAMHREVRSIDEAANA